MKLIKVLHYLPDIDRSSGGVLTYIQVLASAFKDKLELHIVTCHTADEMQVENCRMHYLSSRYLPKWNTKQEFLSILNEMKPDVFHTNSCWIPLCSFTAIWAKQAGYKVVYTTHGMMEPWIMKRHFLTKKLPALVLYQRCALKKVDMIHATSEYEMRHLLELHFNNKIGVIPNAIDVDSVSLKESWAKTRHILYLGRLHEKKGIKHLLEAVYEIKKEYCEDNRLFDYHVDIVGDSDIDQPHYKDELVEYASKLNIVDSVSFYDGIYDNRKWDMFRNADVFVLPTYSENFGIVVAESLAVGTPVITTQGAPWSSLKTHKCGWWIATGATPLVYALKEYMTKSDEDLEQMGRNGRELVLKKYGKNTIGDEYMKMYSWVLNDCEKDIDIKL